MRARTNIAKPNPRLGVLGNARSPGPCVSLAGLRRSMALQVIDPALGGFDGPCPADLLR